MVPAVPLGTRQVKVALSSLLPLGPLHRTVDAIPPYLLCKGRGGLRGFYPLHLARRSPSDALIMLGVAPLGTPSGSSDLQCQEELKARARTISETSTVSLGDDSQPSSESTAEDTSEEPAPAEAAKPDEDKVSVPEML